MALLAVPAAAQDDEPDVAHPTPKRGGVTTTFTVRYVNDLESDNAGDQLYLFGPRGTACHGQVGYTPTGYEGGTQTIRMGPRASGRGGRVFVVRPTDPSPESSRPLSRWCKGVYRGRVEYQNEDGETEYVKVRFRFRVR